MLLKQEKSVVDKILVGALALFTVVALFIGLHMAIAPLHWYHSVPGVPDTGPANTHFIRDLGFAFLMGAAALGLGLYKRAQRRLLIGIAFIWFGSHGIIHIFSVLSGHSHNGTGAEVALVILPAVLMVALWLRSAEREG